MVDLPVDTAPYATMEGQLYAGKEKAGVDLSDSTMEVAVAAPSVTATPRDSLPPWKFKAMIPMIALLGISYGYDVGNTANIQAPVYEAMGHIELLPWVALSFSTGNAAVIPLIRKLTGIFDLRMLMGAELIVFATGAAITGAAQTMRTFVVGRIITGMGLAGVYQVTLSYVAVFAMPMEAPRIMGLIGMTWATGLISGPLVGAAFAENPHATWRWAMYINLPIAAVLIVGCFFIFPSYRVPSNRTLMAHLLGIDWIGAVLHISAIILLTVSLTFSGNIWAWGSGATIATWVVTGLVFVVYILQQAFCVFTTPAQRIFPAHLIRHRLVGLAALSTCCAACAYAVTLYYLPLFFAFTRGYGAIKAAVHLLPFICVFITSAVLAGALLPIVKLYKIFYVLAGALFLAAGVLMTTITFETPDTRVLGYEAVMGFGLGLVWFHGVSIANAALASRATEDRFDGSALMNMAQITSVGIGLAIAGCVFQNVGFRLLKEALEPFGVGDTAIREALAGVASPIWTVEDRLVVELAVVAVTEAITRLFYLVVASGAVCLLASLLMRWEKLEFRTPERGQSETEREM